MMDVSGVERTHGWILLTLAALWGIANIVNAPVPDEASLLTVTLYMVGFAGVYWVLMSPGMGIIGETGGFLRG